MKVKQATTVRNEFQDVVDSVHYTKEPVIVTKRNKPWALIQPLPENGAELKAVMDAISDQE